MASIGRCGTGFDPRRGTVGGEERLVEVGGMKFASWVIWVMTFLIICVFVFVFLCMSQPVCVDLLLIGDVSSRGKSKLRFWRPRSYTTLIFDKSIVWG